MSTSPTRKDENRPPNALSRRLLAHLIAGTGAGFAESIVMHPLDTLKTRFQAEKGTQNANLVRIWHQTRLLIQEESAWALYKGFVPVCSIITPKVALQFTGLSFFKELLGKEQNGNPQVVPTPFVPVVAGIFTGIAQATLLLTPFELIKVRQQTLRYVCSLHLKSQY